MTVHKHLVRPRSVTPHVSAAKVVLRLLHTIMPDSRAHEAEAATSTYVLLFPAHPLHVLNTATQLEFIHFDEVDPMPDCLSLQLRPEDLPS
jgi:hypothetical protein